MKLKPLDYLLLFLPITFGLVLTGYGDSTILFITSILSILPLAAKMGEATEELAESLGGQIGGLINATFGNAAELIIIILAINKGLIELVKASITGSIIGNLLFVFGLSALVGGLKFKEQKFSHNLSGINSSMLLIAFMSLMIPSAFHILEKDSVAGLANEVPLSIFISILLISVYILSLIFSLKTHNYLFREETHEKSSKHDIKNPVIILLVSTVLLAFISEIFVGQIEHVAKDFGLTEIFIGAVIVAVVGNAAEHIAAVFFAWKNDIELAMNITVGSSLQIALFVAPVAVLFGHLIGKSMDLVFSPFEILAVFASVLIVNEISNDGKCNWFEGAQLLVMYIIIAALFYFIR